MSAADITTTEIDCPVCGNDQHREVCRSRDWVYGVDGDWRFVRCRVCKHMYLNPRPTVESLGVCYPPQYAPHGPETTTNSSESAIPAADDTDQSMQVPVWRRMVRAIPGLRALLRWLGDERATGLPEPPVPGQSRLLEIGCAHGLFLRHAREIGWRVDGIEPSESAAQRGRAEGLDIRTGTIDQLELEPQSREMVAAWMVLEHVPNPCEVLTKVHDVLVPGGVFAFSVPNARCLDRWCFGRYWQGYDPPRHLQIFCSDEIRRLLGEHGFQKIEIVYQSAARDWLAGIAATAMDWFPQWRWPHRAMAAFRGEPPTWFRWLMLLPCKLLAVARLSGRITVLARRLP